MPQQQERAAERALFIRGPPRSSCASCRDRTGPRAPLSPWIGCINCIYATGLLIVLGLACDKRKLEKEAKKEAEKRRKLEEAESEPNGEDHPVEDDGEEAWDEEEWIGNEDEQW